MQILIILCLNCTRSAEIFTSLTKSESKNTMVTSDFRPEVEIWPLRACAMNSMQYNHYYRYISVIKDNSTGLSFIVRLVGGPSSHEGRLEVRYNNVWGTVCDDGFTDTEAAVACRSLNFTYVLSRQLEKFF